MKTRLKRYIIAVIISAAIAVIIALPASAANIYFTSVNNILMPLRDDTMPISYNGAMYIPDSEEIVREQIGVAYLKRENLWNE